MAFIEQNLMCSVVLLGNIKGAVGLRSGGQGYAAIQAPIDTMQNWTRRRGFSQHVSVIFGQGLSLLAHFAESLVGRNSICVSLSWRGDGRHQSAYFYKLGIFFTWG